VAEYRTFRNDDPPGLVTIWNEAFTERGAVQLRHSAPLERHIFSKPYFDAAGLVVAVQDGVRVGFGHAAFGPNSTESGLSYEKGVTCMIGVRPAFRRRGIGSELLARCEAYLSARGAGALFAGPMQPLNPFYLALYGGSALPGFLDTDKAAAPFFEHHGYQALETSLVFHRRLAQSVVMADGRFAGLRRRFEVRVLPRTGPSTWWQECVLSAVEPLVFRLEEAGTGLVAGQADVWEMEGFSWRWGLPTVGIMAFTIQEGLRRQGLGKFLLAHVLKYLQDQFFGLVEVQAMARNEAAVNLYRGLGFEQVDSGRAFRK
jgi:ribosomal protein S18 acetylase RimI-like enzyme